MTKKERVKQVSERETESEKGKESQGQIWRRGVVEEERKRKKKEDNGWHSG